MARKRSHLTPTDDDVDEENESISISGSTLDLTVTGTTITITDDDTRGVTVSTTTLTIDEGIDGDLSRSYWTVNRTARSDGDAVGDGQHRRDPEFRASEFHSR